MTELLSPTAPAVEMLALDEIRAFEGNSKAHPPEQVAALARSIREFGFTAPVLIDETGTLLAGHGRVLAAREVGLLSVPAIRVTHLTANQKRAYVIADNRLTELGGWDEKALAEQIQMLMDAGVDVSVTGFDDKDSKRLLAALTASAGNTDPDAAPPLQKKAISRRGDVWTLGRHRVMCGDSTAAEDVAALMGTEKVDAVVTDPPYGIGIDGQKRSVNKNPKHNRKAHEFKGWDSCRPPSEVFSFLLSLRVATVIWGGNYFADMLPASRGWVYWNKGQDGLSMSDGELAWTSEHKPLRAVTVNRGALQGSVHPTQKPLQVIEFSMAYIGAGKRVLDLFGGSGTTLIAAEKNGRDARLMELDPRYCDVIVRRWQEFTGLKAVHAGDGVEFDEIATLR